MECFYLRNRFRKTKNAAKVVLLTRIMGEHKKVNIKELSQLLNMSASTVSRALRDSHEISEGTKKIVQEAAKKYNYTPNPYASSLRKKNSKTIAIILPEVTDNYFSLVIKGAQSVAETLGYHVLIYLSHEKLETECKIIEACTSGRVDGVLISVTSETKDFAHFKQLQQEEIPIVSFDRVVEGFDVTKVITNDFDSGYLAAQHLIDQGVKFPVFLTSSQHLHICQKRAAGFQKALLENGLTQHPQKHIIDCTEEPYQIIRNLLNQPDSPDGIVAAVERLAFQTYFVSQEIKREIPSALKVIAFSTLEIASLLNPSLTTITQPAFETGKKGAELLFKIIQKKSGVQWSNETIVLSSDLIERRSTERTA